MNATTKNIASMLRLPPISLAIPLGFALVTNLPGAQQTPAAGSAESEIVVQDPFVVRADSSVGYQTQRIVGATRTNEALIDIPQAVVVFNQHAIEDTGSSFLNELFRFVSNAQGNSSLGEDQFTFRGRKMSERFDGLALQDASGFNDMSVYERVEFIKGGNAVLFGNSSEGGILNIVYKRPLSTPQRTVKATVGNWNWYRGEVDLTGPLWKGKKVQWNYRTIAAAQDNDTWRDNEHWERKIISQSFEALVGNSTTLTLRLQTQHEYQEGRYQRFPYAVNGVRQPWNPKINAADPLLTPTRNDISEVALYVRHLFSPNWGAQVVTVWQNENQNEESLPYLSALGSGPIRPVWTRGWRKTSRDQNILISEFNLVGSIPGRLVNNKVLFGFDHKFFNSREEQFRTNLVKPFDFSNPNYGDIGGNPRLNSDYARSRGFDDNGENFSVYLQDKASFLDDRLIAIAGVNYVYDRDDTDDWFGKARTLKYTHAVVPRYALLYKFNDSLSAYVTRGETYGARPSGLDFQGSTFSNTGTATKEGGFKFDLFNKAISATAIYFDTTIKGALVPDPAHVGFNQQTGTSEATGTEFDLAGQLGRHWFFQGGMGWIFKNKITYDSRSSRIGLQPVDSAPVSGGLFAKYAFDEGAVKGLELGLGFQHMGKRWADTNNTPTERMDAYTIANAMASYRWKGMRFALNVNNLFNKLYEGVANGGRSVELPGDRRSVRFTVSKTW